MTGPDYTPPDADVTDWRLGRSRNPCDNTLEGLSRGRKKLMGSQVVTQFSNEML